MNDFTKEELCALRDSRCYHMDDSYPSNDPLFMKLQSMIDSYCEPECDHRSNGNCYLNGEITTIPTDVYKCKYCDKFYKCIFENGQCVGYKDIKEIE